VHVHLIDERGPHQERNATTGRDRQGGLPHHGDALPGQRN